MAVPISTAIIFLGTVLYIYISCKGTSSSSEKGIGVRLNLIKYTTQ